MLGQRGGRVTIGLSLSCHPVHLLLTQLGQALGLGACLIVDNTIVATVCRSLAAETALGLGDGLARVGHVHIHSVVHVHIAGGRATTDLALGTGTGGGSIHIVTSRIQSIRHLGQLLGLGAAGNGSPVLERLAHLGVVAHQGPLLADQIRLHTGIGILHIFDTLVGLVVAIGFQLLLLFLQGSQLGLDLGVDKVVDVLAVPDLGDLVVLPLVVGQIVGLLEIDVVDTSTTVLLLEIPLQFAAVGVVLVVLLERLDGLRNEGLALHTTHGLSNVDTGKDVTQTTTRGTSVVGSGLEFLSHSLGEELVTGGVLDSSHTLGGGARQLQKLDIARLKDILELLLVFGLQVLRTSHINLVHDKKNNLVGEQRLDAVEELDLIANRVTALLGQIHEVHDRGPKMGNGGNGLHFDGVHLFKRVVQNTGGIDGLETQVLVVKVTDEQTLGGESIRLNVDVGTGDAAQEAGLSDVGVTADQEGAGVGVDRGQTTQMLTDLLKVDKGVLETLADGSHTTQGSALELLALEQRLGILDQADVVAGDRFDKMLSSRNLTQSDSEMIGIVEGVHQILVWELSGYVVDREQRKKWWGLEL